MAILVLKSVFFIQIPGLSNLNGFYVNTSVLVMCLSIVKRGKINLAMLILLIAFTILFLVIKSRLGFIATCSLLVFKAFDHFKNKRFKVMSILIFLSALIPLLILKKVSITGRMQINTLIANHVDSLQLFDYNPFTNWYSHTIVNHNAIDVSQVIGEVYNVAFNDYLQILVQYGILPFLAFLALNVYLLYILLRRKKGLYTVCFLIINLMLLTSYPFFIPASLFFLMLFYFEITKKEQLFQLKHTLTKSVLMHSLSFKITTVLLLITLGSVYYYPKYVLFQESEKSTSINELLDSQLTKHAFRNHEIKYWVAKEFISKDPKNAKNTFVYLNDKYLSYNLLLFTAESFERLGDYKEASIYYKKAHVIRPFSLMPVYKQLLISDHLNQKKEVQELLSYYKTMELRIDNEYTDIMTREINQILKKYES
jgi:tetratricopeptide (TPR) repeat protein